MFKLFGKRYIYSLTELMELTRIISAKTRKEVEYEYKNKIDKLEKEIQNKNNQSSENEYGQLHLITKNITGSKLKNKKCKNKVSQIR